MEKSYYFSKNELVLLLGIGNVTEIYGFQMPSENEFDDNAFTMALYQLVKRGCIEMGSEPKLSEDMKWMTEVLRTCTKVLSVVSAEGSEQKCWYLALTGAVVMELPVLSEEVRVHLVSQEKIAEEIFTGADLPENPLENEAAGQKIEDSQSGIKKEGAALLENLSINMDTSQKDILEMEDVNGIKNIVSVWDVADMKVHAPVERLVFYEGSLGYRVLILTDESRQVVFDSMEFRKNLQEFLLEEEKKWSL